MTASIDHSAIKKLFILHNNIPELVKLQSRFIEINNTNYKKLIALYQQVIPIIERELWSSDVDRIQLNLYQEMFRQMEQLFSLNEEDRHSFIVVIPVADRPQHLKSCLDSLLTLCDSFNYGGKKGQTYNKVQVVIADDSKHVENIQIHRQMAEQTTQKGLQTIYFGQDEQKAQVNRISIASKERLFQVLGEFDDEAFYHKGASIMRNITYLMLNELNRDEERLLFYFIDSDQEFKVKTTSIVGDQDVYAINYFYYMDQVFSNDDISVLTGKVVGDPPVSPAVMAGNFLEDVICFLQQMSEMDSQASCKFHNSNRNKTDDASYHDMADLFGFKASIDSYQYQCAIEGEHSHLECFCEFSDKLSHFFYGEHPTRKSYYEHENLFESIKPARTVYTGNYVFKPQALSYFIPFATLKLRMAGPVLGRIIKSEISDRFVSANLPMLHNRTLVDIGQSEFRSGVEQNNTVIDLSDEFERQFFGDVMLFTIEKLTESGYPQIDIQENVIISCLFDIEQRLSLKYKTKHRQIMDKLVKLKDIFYDETFWWSKGDGLDIAKENFSQFINNIEHNFGVHSKAYQLVTEPEHRDFRFRQIITAVKTYAEDRSNWNKWALATNE